MILRLAAVAAALLLPSCATQRQDISANHPRTKPTAPSAIQRQILNAVDAGDGDVTVRLLREQMAARPSDLSIRLELADHYKKLGYPELSLEHYSLAAERFPDDHRLMLLLAQSLDEQGMKDAAATKLNQFLVNHKPLSPELPAWLGILRDELGDHEAAEPWHRDAIALNPSNSKLHNNLGYNLMLQGKRQEAITELRKSLALDEQSQAAHNNIGQALIREGGPTERAEALEHWLKVTGDKAAAHNNAAAALMDLGSYDQAREELSAALRVNRNFMPALKNLALLASLDGKPAALPVTPPPGVAEKPKGGKANEATSPKRQTVWRRILGMPPPKANPPAAAGGGTLASKN